MGSNERPKSRAEAKAQTFPMASPPLAGLRVLELAGLAPGPFTGMLLADFGADVLRIDPPGSSSEPSGDNLTRRKHSIRISLKSPRGISLFRALAAKADILIDPFRPGVLEKLGLAPSILQAANPRLIVARLTGFRRDGRYAAMAGHDINYIALAGVLDMLGRKGEKPYAPGNLLGDFAAGGLTCVLGVLLALVQRGVSGKGQVVEANMVDGTAYLASFLRFAAQGPMWDQPRGENVLDGGCPWYDTYETSDGGFVAVGCLEEHFYRVFVEKLGIAGKALPDRMDRENWPELRDVFTQRFKSESRAHWEQVFQSTDACVTPVLSWNELHARGFKMRPIVDLNASPGLALAPNMDADEVADANKGGDVGYRRGQGSGVDGGGYEGSGLVPNHEGEDRLMSWLGMQTGSDFEIVDGGYVLLQNEKSPKARL